MLLRNDTHTLIMFIVLLLVPGCDKAPTNTELDPITLQIQGTVRSSVSGVPLANTRVTMVSPRYIDVLLASTETDSTGFYSLSYDYLGHEVPTLHAWKNGWKSQYSGQEGVPAIERMTRLQTIDFSLDYGNH